MYQRTKNEVSRSVGSKVKYRSGQTDKQTGPNVHVLPRIFAIKLNQSCFTLPLNLLIELICNTTRFVLCNMKQTDFTLFLQQEYLSIKAGPPANV